MSTLTLEDIEILNAARNVLKTLASDASMAAWRASNDVASEGPHPAGLGRTAEAAEIAEQAIFQALNVAHTYGRMSIPEALLLNRDEARA